MTTLADPMLSLLFADPHQWGPGKVHVLKFDEGLGEDRTFCGKTLVSCPGTSKQGRLSQMTCAVCRNAWDAHQQALIRAAKWQAEHEERRAMNEAAREEASRQRREAYDRYLDSDTWANRRLKVLQRADWVCEGCGSARATQVHHLQYPQDVTPGSREWIASEMLFHLVAVCRPCHERLHSR